MLRAKFFGVPFCVLEGISNFLTLSLLGTAWNCALHFLLLTTLYPGIRFQGGTEPTEGATNRKSRGHRTKMPESRGLQRQRQRLRLSVDDTGAINARMLLLHDISVDLKPAHATIPLKNTFGAAVASKAAIVMADGSVGERLSRRWSSMCRSRIIAVWLILALFRQTNMMRAE